MILRLGRFMYIMAMFAIMYRICEFMNIIPIFIFGGIGYGLWAYASYIKMRDAIRKFKQKEQ